MTFKPEITVSDIVSIASVLLVIIGGFFAFYQWRKNTQLKRAEYINELTEKIRTDTSIKDTIYLLDYSEPWYSESFHGGGELELKVDKTLSYFSYICYLENQKIISDKEFDFFKYEIKRILLNSQVQNYFYNLFHFANKHQVPFTFKYLFEYGKKNKMFDTDFFNSNAHKDNLKYNCYLNF